MRDMEMIQFHPTGLIIPGSVVAGSLLEKACAGPGPILFNGDGERYMKRYAPEVAERATRDVVSRSSFLEMLAGRECEEGAVRIDASHLGADFVEKNFPGMCSRCLQFGYDLARRPVPVSPSAHFVMGGAASTSTARPPWIGYSRPAKTRAECMAATGSAETAFANQAFTDGRPARPWPDSWPIMTVRPRKRPPAWCRL